jgi:hypothetical protein
MKTPARLTRKQRGLNRLQPSEILRRAASRGRERRGRSHRSGVGGALPDLTRGAVDRLAGRRR